jgi:hypothetical protein
MVNYCWIPKRIEKMARSSKKTNPSTFPGLKAGGCSGLILSGAFAPVLKDGVWRRRSINFYLLILILLSSLGVEKGLSQPLSKEESAPQIRLEKVTFQVREIESTPSPLKILEVHVEILNRSQRLTAPPNSIKAVVVPKEIKSSETIPANQFAPGPEEVTLNSPLPPRTRQVLIIGYSIPKEKLESITFEVQINPPEGEKKVVTWEGR